MFLDSSGHPPPPSLVSSTTPWLRQHPKFPRRYSSFPAIWRSTTLYGIPPNRPLPKAHASCEAHSPHASFNQILSIQMTDATKVDTCFLWRSSLGILPGPSWTCFAKNSGPACTFARPVPSKSRDSLHRISVRRASCHLPYASTDLYLHLPLPIPILIASRFTIIYSMQHKNLGFLFDFLISPTRLRWKSHGYRGIGESCVHAGL